MSILSEFEKIINQNKNYLYLWLKYFLDEVPKNDILVNQSFIEDDSKIIEAKDLINILENYMKQEKKEKTKEKENINILIQNYFDKILNYLQNKNDCLSNFMSPFWKIYYFLKKAQMLCLNMKK